MIDFARFAQGVLGAFRSEETELVFHRVQSKSLSAIAYDAKRCVLSVEYQNGLLFEAHQIAEDVFARLQNSVDFDNVFASEVLEKRRLRRVGRVFPLFA